MGTLSREDIFFSLPLNILLFQIMLFFWFKKKGRCMSLCLGGSLISFMTVYYKIPPREINEYLLLLTSWVDSFMFWGLRAMGGFGFTFTVLQEHQNLWPARLQEGRNRCGSSRFYIHISKKPLTTFANQLDVDIILWQICDRTYFCKKTFSHAVHSDDKPDVVGRFV